MRTCLIHAVGVTAIGLLGCSQPPPGSDQSFISEGQVDHSDPAVVLVLFDDGALCSGTLIQADLVLTAAHCIESGGSVRGVYSGTGLPQEPSRSFAPQQMRLHEVADALPHPTYWIAGCGTDLMDVALVRLRAPVEDIEPVALATAPPVVGEGCRAVGFGIHTDENGRETYGQKRFAMAAIEDIGSNWILARGLTGAARTGDSGGPLLCAGRLAGVASCVMGSAMHYQPVAATQSWIDAKAPGDADWGELEQRDDGCPLSPPSGTCTPDGPRECSYQTDSLAPDGETCHASGTWECTDSGYWIGSVRRCI